jgi:DNA-directed RNA polymerase subunit F
MIVKEIISETNLTLAEAKGILNALRIGEEEMRYERRKAFEHTTKFAKLGAKESRELINELLGLAKTKDEVAVRIATLMPQSKSEVRAIYAKERFTLTEEHIEKILDCVANYYE